jgi:hypothetical protein
MSLGTGQVSGAARQSAGGKHGGLATISLQRHREDSTCFCVNGVARKKCLG